MDPLTIGLIVTAILAGSAAATSLAAGVVSVCTFQRVRQNEESTTDTHQIEKTSIIIENESNEETSPDGTIKRSKKQKIVVHDYDQDTKSEIISSSSNFIATGGENKVAEIMAHGGANALGSLAKAGAGNFTGASTVADEDSPVIEVLSKVIDGGVGIISSHETKVEAEQIESEEFDIGDAMKQRLYGKLLNESSIEKEEFASNDFEAVTQSPKREIDSEILGSNTDEYVDIEQDPMYFS